MRTISSSRSRAAALAAFVMAAAFGPAQALAHDDGKSLPSFSKIELGLDGHISARCELGTGGDINFGELTGGEVATVNLGFECNVPFDLSFQSARGGLAHTSSPAGQGPFAGTLDYSLDVRVPTRSPDHRTLRASFQSRELMGRKTMSSDDSIAAGGARLQFRTEAPTGEGLLAGEYAETLSIIVTPRF